MNIKYIDWNFSLKHSFNYSHSLIETDLPKPKQKVNKLPEIKYLLTPKSYKVNKNLSLPHTIRIKLVCQETNVAFSA